LRILSLLEQDASGDNWLKRGALVFSILD
jgi:hypothetical protein